MTWREALEQGVQRLTESGIDLPETECRLILCDLSGMTLGDFLIRQREQMPPDQHNAFCEIIDKRCRHIPLQHITGRAYFYGYEFKVSPDVLVPRPETELLVEEALKYLSDGETKQVLDLCTGSGCIACTLSLERQQLSVDASDISEAALRIAKENADRLYAKVRFIQSDLLDDIPTLYDLIVSNPPYIRTKDIDALMPEVRDHDPVSALDGGEDGLVFYKRIAADAKQYLKPNGILMMEIGADQSEDVSDVLAKNGWTEITVIQDYNGLDRIVKAVASS